MEEVLFEVEDEAVDVKGRRQINGVRLDSGVAHLFLLGVLLQDIRFMTTSKIERDSCKMLAIAQGPSSGFEIAFTSHNLLYFEFVPKRLRRCLESPIMPGGEFLLLVQFC